MGDAALLGAGEARVPARVPQLEARRVDGGAHDEGDGAAVGAEAEPPHAVVDGEPLDDQVAPPLVAERDGRLPVRRDDPPQLRVLAERGMRRCPQMRVEAEPGQLHLVPGDLLDGGERRLLEQQRPAPRRVQLEGRRRLRVDEVTDSVGRLAVERAVVQGGGLRFGHFEECESAMQ